MSEPVYYKVKTYRGFWKVKADCTAVVEFNFRKYELKKPEDYIDVSEFFTDENGKSTLMI